MRIAAYNENWFVLQLDETSGRVFDRERRRLFAPMSLVAILARGGWRDFDGDERPILEALSEAQDLSPDHVNQQPLGSVTA